MLNLEICAGLIGFVGGRVSIISAFVEGKDTSMKATSIAAMMRKAKASTCSKAWPSLSAAKALDSGCLLLARPWRAQGVMEKLPSA